MILDARVLVEIRADKEFNDEVELYYKCSDLLYQTSKFVNVEYTWKPPKCSFCGLFGHRYNNCGAKPRNEEIVEKGSEAERGADNTKDGEGFSMANHRMRNRTTVARKDGQNNKKGSTKTGMNKGNNVRC